MHEARADIAKNRLYVRLTGFIRDGEAKTITDKVIEEIKKLKPGFNIINDITSFKLLSPKDADELKRAMRFATEYGVNRVIRIEGNVIGALQFMRMSREATKYKHKQ